MLDIDGKPNIEDIEHFINNEDNTEEGIEESNDE